MSDGVFKANARCAYAWAAYVMSTESETDFEWSVKIIGDKWFEIGIASELKRGEYIHKHDQNAILYFFDNTSIAGIAIGSDDVHENLPEHRTGDVIRFRFQPQRKKLAIYLVRILKILRTK